MTTSCISTRTGVTIVTALLGSALIATAQPRPDNPERRPLPPREFERGERPPQGAPRFEPPLMRVLTEEQRESLREAMEDQREKMRELEEKLRDARRELFEVALTERFDEERVGRKAAELAKLETQLNVLRVSAFSKIRPRLSPEQIERIQNPPPPEFGGRGEPPRRPDFRPGEREPRREGFPGEERPRGERRPERDRDDLPRPR